MLVGVTGAAGFIGIHLVQELSNAGFDVVAIDNFADPESHLRAKEIQGMCNLMNLDILDAPSVTSVFKEVGHVFHLAAETHVDTSLTSSVNTVRTNSLGTASVLEAARNAEASFTYVSTDEVFGDLPIEGRERFDENSALNPSSPYSSSKASGELLAAAWARSYGLKINITNCGNNFGEHQSIKKFIPRTMTLLAANEKPVLYGSGRNVRDWIHARDHARALVSVMINGENGKRYLIGAENPVSNIDLLGKMLEVSGNESEFYDSVDDRPGHDLRYEIEPSAELSYWGWEPRFDGVLEYLGLLWTFYKNGLESGSLDVSSVLHRGISS